MLDHSANVEHIAWALLRRYGMVFRKVLNRESCLPPWRELLRAYWRMEARGEIRGGRFVQGFSGEQFALPDAVAELRNIRKKQGLGELVAISGADPLNLTGVILPGEKISALSKNRLVFREGVLIAQQNSGAVQVLEGSGAELDPEARAKLMRKKPPANLTASYRG